MMSRPQLSLCGTHARLFLLPRVCVGCVQRGGPEFHTPPQLLAAPLRHSGHNHNVHTPLHVQGV
jgi:hypothetical protein